MILTDINKIGKAAGLKGFEMVGELIVSLQKILMIFKI